MNVVSSPQCLLVGLDVGSTTVKAVVLDECNNNVLFRIYRRHHARQIDGAIQIIEELSQKFPTSKMRIAITGSGGAPLAKALNSVFIQEVVANATAVQNLHPNAKTAIELGGQDAKIVFFRKDSHDNLSVSDMRMNGSCAGGTGAFIDEIAALLNIPVEDFDSIAQEGKSVHPISGRCGVFAKTDIQPLIASGVPKQDLALSAFHAIAKQTIGGLAQGRVIEAPVVFEGGPLLFNRTLVDVFIERLNLSDDEVILPEHPDTIVAYGAALTLSKDLGKASPVLDVNQICAALKRLNDSAVFESSEPLFTSDAEKDSFYKRHKPDGAPRRAPVKGETVKAYLGIDSGSTTTKIAIIDDKGRLIDSFYGSNEGDPLVVARDALKEIQSRWTSAGAVLDIVSSCSTGYGEALFAEAYNLDCHVVETVAHGFAALSHTPDATFVLDIGGQDMKALWVNDGVITDIVVNEACSSGCGSFLEGFAASLGIACNEMASAAFESASPAVLGSRCTVFMNSSVITAQRNGKSPQDIMAGLARSVVENVFTKVIRTSNLDALGDKIVVQGGTFANDALLRSFEQYLGKEVARTPYPGLAGAIGAAMVALENADAKTSESTSSFIGIDAVSSLTFERESAVKCPLCSNHCSCTVVSFSSGKKFVTGNKCSRGASALSSDKGVKPKTASQDRAFCETKSASASSEENTSTLLDLFAERERLLFNDYSVKQILPENGMTIGLPRVLSLWDTAPFWTSFFKSLGFNVELSSKSSRKMYEGALSSVASDTACFPAKLVHGHVLDLAHKNVDRIFMPIITAVKPEGVSPQSESMCALVKGYPYVIRSSNNPDKTFDMPFDSPLFHWHSDSDRYHQLSTYMSNTFNIPSSAVKDAIAEGDKAQSEFKDALLCLGDKAIENTKKNNTFAVVLAARPYQNDPLVNHNIFGLFAQCGIQTIPVDALRGISDVDLSLSRLDIVNNYHARLLSSALHVASKDYLEYAQISSFGCGHDAYLIDEVSRIIRASSDKSPLVLKVDESNISGPLNIRIRSFVETVAMRRKKRDASNAPQTAKGSLHDPYPNKFNKKDKETMTVLIPNTSHAFSKLMSAVFNKQGLHAVPLDVGRDEAIRLGKKYTHNDICFPVQMLVGEILGALESGDYNPNTTAVGMGKYVGDCRLTHYSALLRSALDDAGYSQVPIITNDDVDDKNMHPGFKMSIPSALRIAFCLPMIDALEELLRKIRPYENDPGATESAFDCALDSVVDGVEKKGIPGAKRGFHDAINTMRNVSFKREKRRPRVLVVGEYLLNFHPGANREIERYLEDSGMEVVEARMTDVIRKTYFYQLSQVREYGVKKPFSQSTFLSIANRAFEAAHDVTDHIAKMHPLYEPPTRMPELVRESDPIVHHTFDAGEGVLIPAEILHHYSRGVRSFVILQPFGCLPNHIVGRGIVASLRRRCPDAQILTLDYDPDVSPANIENRLQMLIMGQRTNFSGAPL